MGTLDGTVAMITGAARGLGRQHALCFAEAGADLVLVDLCADLNDTPYPLSSRQHLEDTATLCRRLGSEVLTRVADVRDQVSVDAAVAAGVEEFGRIDVLVNNAGLLGPGGRVTHELTEAEWTLVVDVNLTGAWRCCRAVLPQMVTLHGGSIVNIASTGALVAFERFSSYVASKHGLVGLTKALALEYGRHGIRVNAVCPSTIRSEQELDSRSTLGVASLLGSTLEEYESVSRNLHALPDLVNARQVAEASVWLAGRGAAGVTGTTVTVDAGFTAR
ncbi:MAG TPA: SDR family oxidoreductase [Candidatus Limnocylindrales bacterium]|nr:SDR family oxidoreductase [Candidatus Limnocylindrales bacterium]